MPNEKLDQELLEIVTTEKKRDIDRYYQSLLYQIGLKYYLKNHPELKAKFIGSEVILKRETGGELNPDSCLQIDAEENKLLGVSIEIKSSLSSEENVKKELKKMERYDCILRGWETKDGLIDEDVIVFSPYLEDVGRTLRILKQNIENKDLKFTKEILVWQWSLVPSLKNPDQENLLVQQIFGDLSKKQVPEFYKRISDGISQDINDHKLIIETQRNLFTNQKPPVEYTMNVLWQNVFGRVLNEQNKSISAKRVKELINEYYTENMMKNPKNKEYKFKISWAKEALGMFVNIKMARKIGENYEIKLKINKKKIKDYLCERVAICEIKKGLHNNKIDSKIKNPLDFKHKKVKPFKDDN